MNFGLISKDDHVDELTVGIAIGHESVLTAWGFNILRAAAAEMQGSLVVQPLDLGDPIEPQPEQARRIIVSKYVSAAARAYKSPVVLFLDDPLDAVRYGGAAHGASFNNALRLQTASAAGFGSLFERPDVLIIHRVSPLSARATAQSILRHFDLVLSEKRQHAAWEALAPEGATLEAALAQTEGYAALGESGLSAEDRRTVSTVLSPLIHLAFSQDVAPVIWPANVFFSGDHPNEPASLVAEVTGAARILYYGPYFHLPKGVWAVKLLFGFDAEICGTPFSIDIRCSSLLARALVKPLEKGIFTSDFVFEHQAPEEPIEIQLSSNRGAIGGKIALARVEFTRIAYEDALARLRK